MPIYDQNRRRFAPWCRPLSWQMWCFAALFAALSVHHAAGENPASRKNQVVAPGVYTFGHDSPSSERSFYGYLDLAAPRGDVYFTTRSSVTIDELVQCANPSAAEPTRMAQIVRDGAAGIRIPWSPGSNEALVPGDVVIFHSDPHKDLSAETAPSQFVSVAFVGLLGRRPIVVRLTRSNATVPRIVEMLLQSPEVCQTVRVIRTNQRSGPLKPGEVPARLIDGDVLVFDRNQMHPAALAHTQATYETTFPSAIELVAKKASPTPPEQDAITEPAESTENTDVTEGDIAAPRFAAAPEPPSEAQLNDDLNKAAESEPSESDSWDLSSFSPAPAESETTEATLPKFPALASLVEPDELEMDDPLDATTSAHYEAATWLQDPPTPPVVTTVPQPIDASTAAAKPLEQDTLDSFNTVTIAVGVLALAGMCFGVSVLWSRIDRTAQDLQQPIRSRRGDLEDAPALRQLLNRLIVNTVPVIEEQAKLPDRMDYHGEELGRRRLMLDQPHKELMGPHFAVAAGADSSSKPKERVHSLTSGFATEVGADVDLSQSKIAIDHEETLGPEPAGPEPAGPHPATDSKILRNDTATPAAEADETAERQPHARLLDRVLLAMEREKRR